MNFEIGGIAVPIKASLEFSQTYEPIGGSVTHRMQSGRAIKQTHYSKLRTILTGYGWVPVGLDGLDYSAPLFLKCAAPRSISSVSNQLTIPQARRRDVGFEAKGFALVNGNLREVGIAMKLDIAILDMLKGSHAYFVHYYPELIVFADPPQMQGNMTSAEFSWSLNCEEV